MADPKNIDASTRRAMARESEQAASGRGGDIAGVTIDITGPVRKLWRKITGADDGAPDPKVSVRMGTPSATGDVHDQIAADEARDNQRKADAKAEDDKADARLQAKFDVAVGKGKKDHSPKPHHEDMEAKIAATTAKFHDNIAKAGLGGQMVAGGDHTHHDKPQHNAPKAQPAAGKAADPVIASR